MAYCRSVSRSRPARCRTRSRSFLRRSSKRSSRRSKRRASFAARLPRASWCPMSPVAWVLAPVHCRAAARSSFRLPPPRSVLPRGVVARGFVAELRILAWDRMLLAEPRTEVDQPAALAAERSKRIFLRPGDVALAGRTVHTDGHRRLLGAADQGKRHIRFVLSGALFDAAPLEKAHVAAIMTAADLGVQGVLGRQADAQQLVRRLAIEGNVEHAAHGHLVARAPVLARQPEQFRNRIAQRPQQGQPAAEGLDTALRRLIEAEDIIRQGEFP